MSKRLLLVLCCTLFVSMLVAGTAAQQDGCDLDVPHIYTALAHMESAKSEGDFGAALEYLTEVRTMIERIEDACGVGLNWCYPGQPWGDGRCNGPDLTEEQIDWFWTCGTYWARYEIGQLEVVPGWCGFDSDGDGYVDDVDQCPDQGGYVDGNGCPICDTSVDTDCDGTPNSYDQCPTDPNKIEPGQCGCGGPVTGDADCDGTPDAVDQCPFDPGKTAPGTCGCGSPDVDSDGDGQLDCNDTCPMPGDDPWQIGDLCKNIGGCYSVTQLLDQNNDGCLEVFWTTPASGCAFMAPSCLALFP